MSDEKTPGAAEEAVEKKRRWIWPASGLIFLLLLAVAGIFASGIFASEEENSGEGEEHLKVTEVVSLDPLVVNLADTEEIHYVRVAISLGIYNSTPDVPFFDPVLTMPKLKDRLITVLARKHSSELSGGSAGEQLRREILEKVNQIAEPDRGKVLEVYFTEFIIQ